MRIKYLSLIAAVALVAACESAPKDAGNAAGNGTQQTSSIRPGSQEDFVVNVGDRVFFGFDRYDLAPEARATLDRQASWLKQYPNVTVTIEGHADERGTREYNLALGARRANSIRDYLVSRGVSASRIQTVSFGKEQPIDPGTTEEAHQRNRNGRTAITGGAR